MTTKPERVEDICPRPDEPLEMPTSPLASPIYQAAVYRCESPDQADRLLSGAEVGYVYSRDRNPNSDLLAEKIRELHGADRSVVCGSGMAACSAVLLAHLKSGDHVVVGDQMYGRTLTLLEKELSRLGVTSTRVDACDLAAVRKAMTPQTKLVVVETITNPLVRVVDVAALVEVAQTGGARLVVDNTFASPVLCRPLELGADIVFESLTKIMNGHSDVLLGAVCGKADAWERVIGVVGSYGLSAAPFDSWLAARGIGTLALRAERASANALAAAKFLAGRAECARVYYPGLAEHPDHALARRQFADESGAAPFGSMLSFTLAGGGTAAAKFIAAAKRIPFCPSLGDLSTTLSHPESTSHRGFTPEERAALDITGGTIRLSVGIESAAAIIDALGEGLAGIV